MSHANTAAVVVPQPGHDRLTVCDGMLPPKLTTAAPSDCSSRFGLQKEITTGRAAALMVPSTSASLLPRTDCPPTATM